MLGKVLIVFAELNLKIECNYPHNWLFFPWLLIDLPCGYY